MNWVDTGVWILSLSVLMWVLTIGAIFWAIKAFKDYRKEMLRHHDSLQALVEQNGEQAQQLSMHTHVMVRAQIEHLLNDVNIEELTQNIMDFDALVFDEIRTVTPVYLSFPVYKMYYEGQPHLIVKSRNSNFCLDLLNGPLNNIWVETLISLSKISYLAMKADQKDMLEEFLFRKLPLEYAYIAVNMAEFFECGIDNQDASIVELMNNFFAPERNTLPA